MKQKLISLLLALAIMLSLAACGNTPDPNPSGSQSAQPDSSPSTIVFTDDLGREVVVPENISKIVPTGPLAQIILYAIAPEMMVGLASKWNNTAKGIVPEEYLNLPYFGQLYNSANLNVEQLAAAGPELVIDIGRPIESGKEDMHTLEQQTQIPAVFISASLETMPETFRKLGKLLNKEEKGEELAVFCEKVWTRTASILDQVGDNKVDALYVLGIEGLSVLAYNSYHSELIDMMTNNVAVVENPSSKGSGNQVTMEQIATWDPDFVLFASDSIYDTAKDDAVWSQISAIVNDNYIEVPEGPHNWMGTPPAVQRYLGMIWLPTQLYPEYCDYDPKTEILEYYEKFYHCKLTEDQYQSLTENAFLNH